LPEKGLPEKRILAREHEMQTVVIVIHLMIVLAMIGVILLQKSEGGGLGMGGGGGGGVFSSRGTANVLTRTTAFLALGFFAGALLLSILASIDRKPKSILPNANPAQQQTPGGLMPLDVPVQPAAPPPPATPQVPRSQ
jgi:preprotein translocase subunit SecG